MNLTIPKGRSKATQLRLRKFSGSLHPDLPLEPAACFWLAHEVFLCNSHMEHHVAAADGQVIDHLPAHPVLLRLNAGDLADNGILVALDATGHEAGIHDGIQILLHGSSGTIS